MRNSDLTVGSIDGHLRRIAIPSSIGMLFNTLFNVIDTIYAGRLSTNALAGMSISFPVFFLVIAIASGIGTGATTLLANALGAKDKDGFHQYAYNSLALGMVASLVLFVLGQLVASGMLQLMGAEGEALVYALDYVRWIFFGTAFFVLNMVLNGILMAQGDTRSYRNVLIIAFMLNLILDPLFIYGWLGLPRLGTAGVALATIIVQGVGTIYMSYRVLHSEQFDRELFFAQKNDVATWRELIEQGVPASLNMMTIALGVFVINYFVVQYAGNVGIAAYGAAIRVEQLALLPALGLNSAAQTIVGQNYGAKKFARITEVYRRALVYGTAIMVLGMIVIYPTAAWLVGIFNQDPAVIAAGARYLRIEFICFVTYVLMGISIALLQGVKRPAIAIYVGLYRQIVMPIILFYLLGTVLGWGIDGVWYGIVIINWTAAIFTVLYTQNRLKRVARECEQ